MQRRAERSGAGAMRRRPDATALPAREPAARRPGRARDRADRGPGRALFTQGLVRGRTGEEGRFGPTILDGDASAPAARRDAPARR